MGEPQEVMVYYDKDKRRLVWYEFQANVCYDGLRPYSAILRGEREAEMGGATRFLS